MPTYTGLWDAGLPVQIPYAMKIFSEKTGLALGRLESSDHESSTPGSSGRSKVPKPFTQTEYEISKAEMQNGFDLTVCIYTEAGKLLTEGTVQFSYPNSVTRTHKLKN